jgi:hypothetical protein
MRPELRERNGALGFARQQDEVLNGRILQPGQRFGIFDEKNLRVGLGDDAVSSSAG